MPQPFLIFVPGILGTELWDADGQMVWGGKLSALIDTLCFHPRALTRNTLRIGSVIEFISGIGTKPVYGKLLRLIRDRFGETGFHAFPYDWRQTNVKSAEELANFIRVKAASGVERFSIIAHSMGGLVTRLALHDPRNLDLLPRLSGYVQIATPVWGSSKSYATLKRGPDFSGLFEWIVSQIQWTSPRKLHDLLDSLGSCDAIFQLLPPPDEKMLRKESGSLASPFDTGVWSTQYMPSIGRAKAIHAQIRMAPPCKHYTILSNDIDTDYGYEVDRDFNILKPLPQSGGDGTVCEHSAGAASDRETLFILSRKLKHDELPNDIEVFDTIVNSGWLGESMGPGRVASREGLR